MSWNTCSVSPDGKTFLYANTTNALYYNSNTRYSSTTIIPQDLSILFEPRYGFYTWTTSNISQPYYANLNYNNITFSNDILIVTVANGEIYNNNNTANVWAKSTINNQPTSRNWSSISNDEYGRAVATVNGGYLYYSSDYGNTWTVSASINQPQPWSAIYMNNTGNVIASIYAGGIYYSSNGGQNWTASVYANQTSIGRPFV
jgi:photosystem II stability/assembly factor-like uncharacterized protein